MSGSIACAKAATLISEWSRHGNTVRVACTRSVEQFIGRATLEGLGADQVFDDVFAAGQAMDHVHLARWADVVVVCPATSNLINRLAAGIADDAVTTVWQVAYGSGLPMVLVPAMNTSMWEYPATRESVSKLRSWGVLVMPTAEGNLACGEHGAGRMLEPAEIMARLDKVIEAPGQTSGKTVLITAGGTREPIDSVRYIGNFSTGRTAAKLTEQLTRAGHRVTWLGAEDAIRPKCQCQMESFVGFNDLDEQLKFLLSSRDFDAVIHAAAVSDFSVAAVEAGGGKLVSNTEGKLSSASGFKIHLEPNPKLLGKLREYSRNQGISVVGFKLTDTDDPDARAAAIAGLFEAGVEAVVHNDVEEISEQSHPFILHTCTGSSLDCRDSSVLARHIDTLLEKAS